MYCLRSTYQSLRFFFFFNDTATTEIYTLSLHDALPIYEDYWDAVNTRLKRVDISLVEDGIMAYEMFPRYEIDFFGAPLDRKSTRLNSSHANISYAVFCLKKKKNIQQAEYCIIQPPDWQP